MLILTNNKHFAGRFAPCVSDLLLLKPLAQRAKRAVAQKVLLFNRRLGKQPVLNELHCPGFNA